MATIRKEKEETINRLAKPCGGLWFVPGGDTIVEVCGQDSGIVVIGGSRKGGFHRYKRDDVTEVRRRNITRRKNLIAFIYIYL